MPPACLRIQEHDNTFDDDFDIPINLKLDEGVRVKAKLPATQQEVVKYGPFHLQFDFFCQKGLINWEKRKVSSLVNVSPIYNFSHSFSLSLENFLWFFPVGIFSRGLKFVAFGESDAFIADRRKLGATWRRKLGMRYMLLPQPNFKLHNLL